MRLLTILFVLSVSAMIVFLVQQAGRVVVCVPAPRAILGTDRLKDATARVDECFRRSLDREQLEASEPADELTVLRRLSLALHGTIPSLEEIRSFEADTQPDRVARWTMLMLTDQRFCDYFSERLARSLAGVEEGPFILFRRDRLTAWLSEQLRQDTPWTEMAVQLIAAEGLWTDRPATNFITVARINDEEGLDKNKLAGRTVRTFLGQRIDCAQCHDHFFDERWKQSDFEGLAAWFSQAQITFGGVTDRSMVDGQPVVYRVVDPGAEQSEGRLVEPTVPFHPEWCGTDGSLRQRLATWVVHPENRRFERAIANRIWGLMFGRPFHDPVDDLPHPADDLPHPADDLSHPADDVLDILGSEFRSHGGRLSTLIRIIAGSDAFRRSSEPVAAGSQQYQLQLQHWGVFPLVRLRPEQVIGSMIQAGSVRTIDRNSHLLIRFLRFTSENDFLKEYGDSGDDELTRQVGTIPQALLRMHGRFTNELTKVDGFSAAAQILRFSADDEAVVENCFLACLTRRPTSEERLYFVEWLRQFNERTDTGADTGEGDDIPAMSKEQAVQDLYWMLFNSPEFSWNH